MMNVKKYISKMNYFEKGLLIVFLLQLGTIIYFNLAMLENHMGYDSSWAYLKTSLIYREKTLACFKWADQTSPFLDSSVLIAAFLYAITGKLFLSYGLSNILILFLIIFLMFRLCKKLDLNVCETLICMNMIVCPYMTNGFGIVNDLGYFNDLLGGPGFYGLRTMIILMITDVFLELKNNNRKISAMAIISILLCMLAGISSGLYMIVIILIPCVLYVLECALIENDIKKLVSRESIYSYMCIIFAFAGKVIGENYIHVIAADSKTWTSIENIWTNFGAVFQGLMKLLCVLPVNNNGVEIFSAEGIIVLFPLCMFVIIITAIIFCFRECIRNLKNANKTVLFISNIVICNIIIFGLFNVRYGTSVFEERYLIGTYMAIILLVGYFLSRLDKKLLISITINILLAVSVVCNDLASDYIYINTTNDSWEMENITQIVNSTDAQLIYVWGDSVLPLGRAMRVYDMSHIYKCVSDEGTFHHWGDYLYLEKNEDYNGATLLIVPNANALIPPEILEKYVLLSELTTVSVYVCDGNPIKLTN